MNECKYASAIITAKQHRRPGKDEAGGDGGPPVPADQVLLMELAWALELLLEPSIDISFKPILQVYEQLLKDLKDGKLIAYTLAENALIGRDCWPESDRHHPYKMSFYLPYVFEGDCMGHGGATPVVPEARAIEWLKNSEGVNRKNRPKRKFKTTSELEQACLAWITQFDGERGPPVPDRDRWAWEQGLSREEGRALFKRLAPVSWGKPGPRGERG
ncbi:MAG: hypothetical protein RID23_16355 [Roseovarius sp.]